LEGPFVRKAAPAQAAANSRCVLGFREVMLQKRSAGIVNWDIKVPQSISSARSNSTAFGRSDGCLTVPIKTGSARRQPRIRGFVSAPVLPCQRRARPDTPRLAAAIAAPRIIQPPNATPVINGRATAEPMMRAVLVDIVNADWY
jgi:hypothetical protein